MARKPSTHVTKPERPEAPKPPVVLTPEQQVQAEWQRAVFAAWLLGLTALLILPWFGAGPLFLFLWGLWLVWTIVRQS